MTMDQGNKHGPLLDDRLAGDTAALTHGAPDDGRTERRRDQVGGDGEPDTTVDRGEIDRLLDRRADLASALSPVRYPAGRTDLLEAAAHAHVPAATAEAL